MVGNFGYLVNLHSLKFHKVSLYPAMSLPQIDSIKTNKTALGSK